MKIVEAKLMCPYCKNEINTLVTMSEYIPFQGLDLKNPRGSLRAKLDHCEKCHYTFLNGNVNKYDPITEIFLNRDQYKNIWNDDSLDDIEKEHLSYIILAMHKYDHAVLYLDLAWHNENKNNYDKAKEYRLKFLEVARELIDEKDEDNDENLDAEMILGLLLQMCDSYRQLENYDKALDILKEVDDLLEDELSEGLKEEFTMKLIDYEKELISNKDSKEHYTNEIK